MDIFYAIMTIMLILSFVCKHIWVKQTVGIASNSYNFRGRTIHNGKLKPILFAVNISLLFFLLLLAFRAISVGRDTQQYELIFKSATSYDLNELNSFVEIGFLTLNRLIYVFTDNFRIALIIYACLSMAGPAYLIKKYSRNPFYSLFLFISMGFYITDMSATRTAIATSILCFAFDFALQRKFNKYILAIIIAAFFHRTAFSFLIVYPLIRRQMTPFNIAVHIGGTICVYLLRWPIIRIVISIPFFSKYEPFIKETGAINYALIILAVFIIMMVFYNGTKREDKKIDAFYNMLLIAFTLQIFGSVNTNMIRLTEMFYFYAIILVPNVIECLKVNSNRIFMYIGFSILMIAQYYLVYSGTLGTGNYTFFWK